jgi:phage gpG-like protein
VATVQGLRLDRNITAVQFSFVPSVGIVAAQIDKLGLDIRSFKVPLTRSVDKVMIPSIRANFEAEGRPPWEPLADYTIEVRGSSGPILNRSGRLKRMMGARARWTITSKSATIFDLPESIWYGKVHQGGASVSIGKIVSGSGAGAVIEAVNIGIPQRQFVMFQPEDEENIEKVFGEWLDERIARAGFHKGI